MKEYWYEEVCNTMEEKSIFALAANKSDLYLDQKINNKEGKEFADKMNAIFQTTSAMNDTGIKTLFENIGKKILIPEYDYNNSDNSLEKNYSKKIQQEKNDKKYKLEKKKTTEIKKENKKACC